MKKLLTYFLLVTALISNALAQDDENTELTRLLFVFDASNSMNATWQSDRKITIARRLLSQTVAELDDNPNVELGLRVYGHQVAIEPGKQDCEDTKLEVSFRAHNGRLIQNTLNRVTPKGTTPIARSLELAAGDFPECANCRNIIILITDGIEACDGDPCAISKALQARGVILKPFVIGVGLDEDFIGTFNCVGNYYDASSEETFEKILDIVVTQALNNTTAQISLNDDFGKPRETNVTVNLIDEHSEELVMGMVHTLNQFGNPDTLSLDPIITYRVEAHTIPLLVKEHVKLNPGKHNTIVMDAGQGDLVVQVDGNLGDKIPIILRKQNDLNTAHVMYTNKKERILTDVYDLEILTLPRTEIKGVKISQDQTTTVAIAEPGVVNLSLVSPGSGSIAKMNGSKLEWVLNLNSFELNQQITLQPGKYKITYRSNKSKKTLYTKEREFTVESGSSTNLKL